MKSSIRTFSLLAGIVWSVVPGIDAQVNVTQEHNNLSRDGLYIDAGFTPAAAAGLTRDLNFNGTISGNVYAQPLYIEGGPNGPMIIRLLNRTMSMRSTPRQGSRSGRAPILVRPSQLRRAEVLIPLASLARRLSI